MWIKTTFEVNLLTYTWLPRNLRRVVDTYESLLSNRRRLGPWPTTATLPANQDKRRRAANTVVRRLGFVNDVISFRSSWFASVVLQRTKMQYFKTYTKTRQCHKLGALAIVMWKFWQRKAVPTSPLPTPLGNNGRWPRPWTFTASQQQQTDKLRALKSLRKLKMAGEFSRESDQLSVIALLSQNNEYKERIATLEKEVESLKQRYFW